MAGLLDVGMGDPDREGLAGRAKGSSRESPPAGPRRYPIPRATGSSKAAERLTGGASPNSRTRPHAVIV